MFDQEIQVLKCLTDGVNFFTGEKCSGDCILNDVDIVRTLCKVTDVLSNLKPEKIKQDEFVCPVDLMDKFEYEEEMNMTSIIEKISKLYPDMKKLKHNQITEILIEKGMLTKVVNRAGKSRSLATPKAREFGIYNVHVVTKNGKFDIVNYDINGQKYVLTCLKELGNKNET